MSDSQQDCARYPGSRTPWTGNERRRHPRRATDAVDGSGAESLLEREMPDRSFLARVIARLGLPVPAFAARMQAATTPHEVRRRRLPGIVRKLEIVLAELDDISAWREAADVCSALERLSAEMAEDDHRKTRTRWTF